MDLQSARFLTSPDAAEALSVAEELAGAGVPAHTAIERLRAHWKPDQARVAWELALVRRHAQTKLGEDAARLFFDREGLEMASSGLIAGYHAGRLAGARHVLDLGGGVGIDSMAFARAGLTVTLFERDPARAILAEANFRALGMAGRVEVICGDATQADLPPADAAFLDPMRRSEARRWAGSAEEIEPPLPFARSLLDRGIGMVGIKLSPASPHEIAGEYGGEWEFLSERGECKEAFLALGGLKTGVGMSAALLSERNGVLVEERLAGNPDTPCPAGPPNARFLYEPDPAVIRAHLVATLASSIGAWQLDPGIAYLLGDAFHDTPFASAFRIEESLPYNKRAVQAALRRLDISRLVVKKRGFPLAPEAVLRDLKLAGDRDAVLILARCGKRHWAFIASRVS